MSFFSKLSLLMLISILTISQVSCDFEPLYGPSESTKSLVGKVKVLSIPGKAGFHLRENLVRRFGQPNPNAHILEIILDTSKIKEVITPTNEITSYQLEMTASYTFKDSYGNLLVPAQQLLVRTGFSSASNSTGYSTKVAEEAAIKRLATKLGEDINTQLMITSRKLNQ